MPRVKQIDIPVCFLQEQFDNSIFVPKYEKCSIVPSYMCTKPCLDPIISWITKCMTEIRLYSSSDTRLHQLMKLHDFYVNLFYYGDCIV